MVAKSEDGHGAPAFFDQVSQPDLRQMLASFLERSPAKTLPDQWQSQIFIRVRSRARVIYVSDAPDEMVAAMHMLPVHSVEEAVKQAKALCNQPHASIAVIPDGVSVIIEKSDCVIC